MVEAVFECCEPGYKLTESRNVFLILGLHTLALIETLFSRDFFMSLSILIPL